MWPGATAGERGAERSGRGDDGRGDHRPGGWRADLVGHLRGARAGGPSSPSTACSARCATSAWRPPSSAPSAGCPPTRRASRRCSTPTSCASSGAFVPLVCHDPARRDEALGVGRADGDAAARPSAPTTSSPPLVSDPADWARPERVRRQWAHLFAMLDEVEAIAARPRPAPGRPPARQHARRDGRRARPVARRRRRSPICLDTGHLTIGGADPLDIAERVRRPRRSRPPEGRPDRRRRPARTPASST